MTGISIKYNFALRRDGDIDEYFTDVKIQRPLKLGNTIEFR